MAGPNIPAVDPKDDLEVKLPNPPAEQVRPGDVPGGAPAPEAHDLFRAELDRGQNPSIRSNDRTDLTVKTNTTVLDAQGREVKLTTFPANGAEYGFSPQGEKFRKVVNDGVTTWQSESPTSRTRPLVERTPAVAGDNTGNLNPQRELTRVLPREELNTLRTQIQGLPRPDQAAAWADVHKGVKARIESGAVPGSTGLIDRATLPAAIRDSVPAALRDHVAPVVRDGVPVKDAVAPVVRDGVPVKDAVLPAVRDGVPQLHVPGQKPELTEQQRAAVTAWENAYRDKGPGGAREEYRALRNLLPDQTRDITKEFQTKLREAGQQPGQQPGQLAVAELIRQRAAELPVTAPGGPLKDIPKELKGGVQFDAARQAQIDLAAQRAIAMQQQGDRKPEPGREIKLPGEIPGQHGPMDGRQLQELLARQQREQGMPPGLENKLRGNPDVLAALQASIKDGRDRIDARPGDLGLRGRPDAGDQSLRALDALKGGPNLKGIPGFDPNDKTTREFLADAMKRLELTKGQRLDDIFKGLDPTKADRLTKFLTDGSTDGKFNPLRVRDFMGMADQLKSPTDRLADFLKGNKDLINNQQLSAKDTQRALGDLTKILGDFNKQLNLDGKSAINIQDVLGRKLDPTRPGERLAAMEMNGVNRQFTDRADAMAMTARMTAAQEISLRQMLDLRNGRDAAATQQGRPTGQEGMQAGREVGAGARFEGPHTRLDAAQVAAQNAARMDVQNRPDIVPGTKMDVPIKAEARPETTIGKPDAFQVQKQQDIVVAGAKSADVKGPDVVSGQDRKDEKFLDEKTKLVKKEEEEKEKHEKEEQHKREEKARLDALMLAALAEKKRKQLEQEQKEKEKSDEKDKQRDKEKRRRYIVREKDTLPSIASDQLRDVKLSPLIYEINKEVIQLRVENGKQVPDLKPKMIIWLPSSTEIEEFRKGGLAGAKAAGGAQDKKMSADDELIARFGTGWSGGASGGPATGGATTGGAPSVIPGSQPATSSEVTAALAASAMEAAQKKRANIESLLGPIGRQKPADGRIKYIARLGDSLKSVAMKHPALQDVNLWKLVAEINGISTEVDSRGGPVATLSRGAVLMIPSNIDVENFRQRNSAAPQAVRTAGGVKTAGAVTEVATKLCEGCGRMTVNSASICPACGNAFEPSDNSDGESEEITSDTNTGSGMTSEQAPAAHAEVDASEDAKTVFVAVQEVSDEDAPTRVTTGNQTIEALRDDCRLVKSDGQGIVCQLEVFRDGGWEPIVSYEIYDDVCLRNEYTTDGRKRTVKIDLPPPAARELANNDLNSNWKGYCGRSLGIQID